MHGGQAERDPDLASSPAQLDVAAEHGCPVASLPAEADGAWSQRFLVPLLVQRLCAAISALLRELLLPRTTGFKRR